MSAHETLSTMPIPTEARLAAESRKLVAEHDAAREKVKAAEELFKAVADPTTWKLHVELEELEGEVRFASMMLHVSELARHLPAMAPAIWLIWMHVIDAKLDAAGTCCADGGPVEP